MELKKYKLGEIATIVNGATPSTSDNENYDGEIVWFTPKDLSDQNVKYISKGYRNISQKGYDSCSTQIIPPYNILMSSRAPIGLLAINTIECCTNQGFKNLVVNKSICDVDYLYYFLKFNIWQIDALGSGTTFKEVSKASLERYELNIPCLETQKSIAAILSSLDHKIALNRAINQNLEKMAKQLYDYWFVQFDFPNEEGKPYKSSGGKMVWNEKLKREVPKGWVTKTINEVCTCCRGVSYGKDDLLPNGNGVLVLRGNNIENNHIVYDSNVAFVPYDLINEEQRIKEGDIVMTMSSGSKAHVGKCALFYKDSKHTFGAFLSKFTPKNEMRYMIFMFFTSEYFKSLITAFCNGTGINNLTNQTFDNVILVLPNENILQQFESKVKPLFSIIGSNEENIEVLTKQRDELLPLLMNGQISPLNCD
ncbi:MAG: restriction endonuclease subunit S [Bacteroidales bacterium]|nr:restriction endonuclease subunit S [Bacteroidales bacterium]